MKKRLFTGLLLGALLSLVLAVAAFAGDWIEDSNGWWYLKDDGSYPAGVMTVIDGKWYAFNSYGYMISDQWVKADGDWYYMTGSGAMAKDQWIGDYYVGGDGIMVTNSWIGSYYVGADGKWIPNYGQEQESSSSSSSGIPNEYYTIDGNWDNRQQSGFRDDYRVDCWIELNNDDPYMATMNFGLYTTTGTGYSLYDDNNPNGDDLAIATVDGLNWGCRSEIRDDWFDMEYDGKDTIVLHWRRPTWNSGGTLIFKRRSGGSKWKYWSAGGVG